MYRSQRGANGQPGIGPIKSGTLARMAYSRSPVCAAASRVGVRSSAHSASPGNVSCRCRRISSCDCRSAAVLMSAGASGMVTNASYAETRYSPARRAASSAAASSFSYIAAPYPLLVVLPASS